MNLLHKTRARKSEAQRSFSITAAILGACIGGWMIYIGLSKGDHMQVGIGILAIIIGYILYKFLDRNTWVEISLSKASNQSFSLSVKGKDVDVKLIGEMCFEAWLKHYSYQGRPPIKRAHLSFFVPKQKQIIIRSLANSKSDWGNLRGDSPHPIEIMLDMDLKSLEAFKKAVLQAGMKETPISG